MKCKETRDRLSAYVDGELPESTQKTVQSHLRKCHKCRAELEELRQLAGYLDAVPDATFPASFASEVREKAEERKAAAKIVSFALFRGLRRFSGAAAAMVAIGLGILLGAFMSQSVATGDAALQASFAATEQADEITEMEYHIQALSATPEMSLEQAYLVAAQTTESGTE